MLHGPAVRQGRFHAITARLFLFSATLATISIDWLDIHPPLIDNGIGAVFTRASTSCQAGPGSHPR